MFILLDYRIYREHKINKKTYIVDRVAMFSAFLCAGLINTSTALIVSLAIFLAALYVVKGYYIVLRIREFIEERKLREISDGSVSDVVHNSRKDEKEE